MHLNMNFPARVIAPGDGRTLGLDVEVITTVAGHEVRNVQSDRPLRAFEIPLPSMTLNDPRFVAIKNLWDQTNFGEHSFNHWDEEDEIWVKVRFDGKLTTKHHSGPYYRIETIMLVEVDEDDE